MTKWIMACIESVHYGIIINRVPTYFFACSPGLRQGCLLSPLLFLIVMDGMSRLINKALMNAEIEGLWVSTHSTITHQLFVDDVMIYGNPSPADWHVLKLILDLFCRVSSMVINSAKSILLKYNIDESTLAEISLYFPFTVRDFEEGNRFLGYWIKPNNYRTVDWHWLLHKFDRRIHLWSWKWISIGGRVALAKSVLQNLAVFWISLCKIPKTILTTIRRKISNFIWSGLDKRKIHLCNWQKIASPKALGGWSLKNIFVFALALRAKSLWRVISVDCIWRSIIKDKYFKGKSTLQWLRSSNGGYKGASCIWDGLFTALPVIKRWLVWQPGNGRYIHLGEDPIIGGPVSYKLSPFLLHSLHSRGYFRLHHGAAATTSAFAPTVWLSTNQLGFIGCLAEEWTVFIAGLIHGHIQIKDMEDVLLWAWNTQSGVVTAKLAYESIFAKSRVETCWWYTRLWRWSIPPKLQIFMWLVLENRVLTWENLMHRGFVGPNICPLCWYEAESVAHLFITCPFSKRLWSTVYLLILVLSFWSADSVLMCIQNWVRNNPEYIAIAASILWEI